MSRTLAIGDIHGCLRAFETLLQFIEPKVTDRIILLGDYVDRGPDSCGVLEKIIQLRLSDQFICLRGNHEVMMLAARGDRDSLRFWMQVGGREALESYPSDAGYLLDRVPQHHWHFLVHSLQDYHETDTHIFVHANLHPDLPLADQDPDWLQWNFLEPMIHRLHCSGKIMVCGHSEQRDGYPLRLPGAIGIDTWCYGGGWLTCLDVDSGVYYQANQQGNTRQGNL